MEPEQFGHGAPYLLLDKVIDLQIVAQLQELPYMGGNG